MSGRGARLAAALRFLLAFLLAPPLAAQADETEARQAVRNSSFVPTSEPALQRRLLEGLRRLREGEARLALDQLLPALATGGDAPQLPWGERETRSFFELLADHLEAATPETRAVFRASLEADATRTLARLHREPAWLTEVLRAFPGTQAAERARLALTDLALEAGDGLAAARFVARLPEADRTRRAPLLATLEASQRHGSPWPYPEGDASGAPLPGGERAPAQRPPTGIGRWPEPLRMPELASGVVGRDERGVAIAVFQDPVALHVTTQTDEGFRAEHVPLEALTGLAPTGLSLGPMRPSMLGSRLYLVHGGTGLEDPAASDGGAELFCLQRTGEMPHGFRVCWRWSPASARPDPLARELGDQVNLHPFAVATDRRVFVLLSQAEDRLNTRVYAACLSQDGQLRWLRFLAKGTPPTAELVLHRQETLRQGALRPPPPVLAHGRLVIATGIGIVVALDPVSGEVAWTFRTARVRSLESRDEPWHEPRLAAVGDEVWFTPSDGEYLYRLRIAPGMQEILAALPAGKRSLSRFLGVVAARNASYFFRHGLREEGPLRILLHPEAERPLRYDAPPLQPGEQLAAPPLLTTDSLILATDQSLYWLDLAKDLFYERAFEFPRSGPTAPAGPAVPFAGGVLFAGKEGPVLWR